MSEQEQHSEQSDTHKFWRRGGEDDYVAIHRDGDDLTIEIEDGSDYVYFVVPRAAESLLQWLARSRS